ncbi:TonB-dependent receptor [uncultured Parasphingorhabdus sp.]|uniref:TonB-dependent receptor n=1 Tax=uncultured Parasphingorhabdus sp. TaxID=2709694 RepID=UPI002AA76901|nr:TonB-dependent receptor [uncultured Parasphingorhabdus sp.]
MEISRGFLKSAVIVKFTALASTSMFAVLASASVFAKENVDEVAEANEPKNQSEIVVTARRGEEDLSDVPLVITAFGADKLEQLNIASVDDLAKFSPGLEFTEGVRPGATKISLRGLNVDLGRSSVALRIDDADVTTEAVYGSGVGYFPNQRLLDLERIEVVKGSQVALYGRSAFGGAINFVTRRPDLFDWSGSVAAQVASEREWELSAKVRGPILEGKVGLGMAAAYWDDGGSYRNRVSGSRIGTNQGHGVSGSLLIEPSYGISNYLRIEYSEQDSKMSPANFLAPNTTVSFAPDAAAALGVPSTNTYLGKVPSSTDSGAVFIPLDPFNGNDFPGTQRKDTLISNILEIGAEDIGIKSISSYLGFDQVNQQTNNFQPQPWVNPDGTLNSAGTGAVIPGVVSQVLYLDTQQDLYSQEFQIFSDNPSSSFRWMIGGLYWREKISQGQDQPTVIPLGQISTADIRSFFRGQLLDNTRTFSRKTEHISAFVWTEMDMTSKLSVSLEGRYASEDISYRTNGTVNISLGIPVPNSPPIFQQVTVVPGVQEPGFSKDSYFTPKGTITFKPNDDLTIYASVAKAVKPAGHSTNSADSFNDSTLFKAEQLWSYEAGIKSVLADGAITFNGSVFYQDYTDQQVSTTVLDLASQVPRPAIANAGKSRIYGADIDFSLSLSDQLTVSGAYTYLDAKFTDYEFFTSTAGTAVNGSCVRIETVGAQDGCIISLDGKRPGQVPKHQWQLFASYATPISDSLDLFIEPSLRYKGERYTQASNLITAPDYYRADLRAGIASDKIKLTFFIENLFDDDTPTNVVEARDFTLPGYPVGALVFLPDPINVGLNFKYSF